MPSSTATLRVLNRSFGKLFAFKILYKLVGKRKRAFAKCRCECKSIKLVLVDNLLNGSTSSCGCAIVNKHVVKLAEYRVYHNMLQRCFNEDNPRYADWGGRGISVHKRYLGKFGFKHFIKDIGYRSSNKYSLDRIDNDEDYAPGNIKWSTRREQQNNKRQYKK